MEYSWPISWWKSIVILFQSFNIVFLLWARVGWCHVCTDFTNVRKVDDVNNSDGKASLKRQKSPENTTDAQGMSKFYWFYEKKCSYFEICIVVDRPYFVPYTIPYNVQLFLVVYQCPFTCKPDCNVDIYADDTTLWMANSNPLYIQHGLQGSLNKANLWFSLNKMVPNAKRTKQLLVGTK